MKPADEASARVVSRIVSHVRELDAAVAKADARRASLLAELREIAGPLVASRGGEVAHIAADAALLEFIGDPEVTAAHEAVAKWYS